MKLYKNLANRKNKNTINKSRQNSTQQLKKNRSLTYYHFDGQINYINKLHVKDYKIENNNNKKICNNNGNKCNNNNQSFSFFNNHEYNENLLFNAYKKSVLELFKALKIYMNNQLYKYNKIKKEFIYNIQKFYDEEKRKEKKINKTSSNYNIKSYSKNKIKENYIKSKNKRKNNEDINNSVLGKNANGYRTSVNKSKNNINNCNKTLNSYKYSNGRKSNQIKDNSFKNKTNIIYNNKSMNKTNISGISLIQKKSKNNYIDSNSNNNNNNHKSLYTLLKKNKEILVNSPIKNICNKRNDNVMNNFIKFSKDILENKNSVNKTCNQSNICNNKFKLKEEKPNNNDNNKISEKPKNNELISKIKDSLDDNLKHIFNFSYENFLNKESERECN